MIKKQEPTTDNLFPIGQNVLNDDFRALGKYSTDDLSLLKNIWRDSSLERNPSHTLLELAFRPELESSDQIRRAYRAGILVGTIIMRHRLYTIETEYSIVDLSSTPVIDFADGSQTLEQFPSFSQDMKLSRFALSQFFDSKVDVAEYLKTTLEADWLHNHNTFIPSATDSAPQNDWLAVGMGDTLALYGTLYALHAGYDAPDYITKQLADEPSIGLVAS